MMSIEFPVFAGKKCVLKAGCWIDSWGDSDSVPPGAGAAIGWLDAGLQQVALA
jgi:hypothetical protein